MALTHSRSERLSDTGPQPLVNPDELRRHQRALRILIVVLIPLAIWTIVGLITFWPGDISRHVNADVAGYSVPGVSYPTARITDIKPISCEGLSGSTPGATQRPLRRRHGAAAARRPTRVQRHGAHNLRDLLLGRQGRPGDQASTDPALGGPAGAVPVL